MQEYSKIQRKIISHPKEALNEVRLLLHRHTGRANACLKCGVVGGQYIHHTLSSGVIHYRCSHCVKTYSEFLGTPLYRSKLKSTEWLTALLEMATATG
jgi:transposase-like protein